MGPFCYLCFMFLFVILSCLLDVTCLEMVELLALLYVMFSTVFVTFPYGALDQVRYLIVSVPDLCLLLTVWYPNTVLYRSQIMCYK